MGAAASPLEDPGGSHTDLIAVCKRGFMVTWRVQEGRDLGWGNEGGINEDGVGGEWVAQYPRGQGLGQKHLPDIITE